MNFIKKINTIFGIKEERKVEGAEIWMVSWQQRVGDYWNDKRYISKAFLSNQDAEDFAQSLKDAKELLQDTDNIHITINKMD